MPKLAEYGCLQNYQSLYAFVVYFYYLVTVLSNDTALYTVAYCSRVLRHGPGFFKVWLAGCK